MRIKLALPLLALGASLALALPAPAPVLAADLPDLGDVAALQAEVQRLKAIIAAAQKALGAA